MVKLQGFSEYKKEHYESSCFTTAIETGEKSLLLCHDGRQLTGVLTKETPFDVVVAADGEEEFTLPKVEVMAVGAVPLTEVISKLVKQDKKVVSKKMGAILAPAHRHFIKNKTLYPLMQERQVLFFTLLEGELIKGIVVGFSRYDVTVHMKSGAEITLLRHAIFDVRDKRGRCYLKSVQQSARDWKKSELYA